MKNLCMVAYVYGEKYQYYIPLYILSLHYSYPDYDIRIYIDNTICENVKKQLDILKKIKNNFYIIENFAMTTKFSKKAQKITQIQRCQRWLFFDEAFLNYKSIYIGDIDLFICKEDQPLFEQHIKHCEFIKKPYSNISRISKDVKKSFYNFLKFTYKFSFPQTLKFFISKKYNLKKLSGLHFIITELYYTKCKNIFDEIYNELNLLAEGKSLKYNLCNFNNEGVLYDISQMAGFGELEASYNEYNIENDPFKHAYRPHHGIHLGIFRDDSIIKNEMKVITSKLYIGYYQFFKEITQSEIYREIYVYFSEGLILQLEKMSSFYYNLKEEN